MRIPPFLCLLSLTIAVALFAACGSDGTGTTTAGTTGTATSGLGGSGGSGGAGGAGGSGGAGGGLTEGAAEICYRGCEASIALGCFMGTIEDCVSVCIDSFISVPACAPEQAAYQDCILDRQTCDVSPACQELFQTWELCTTGGCVDVACMPKSGGCACAGTCKDRQVAAECVPAAGGGASCTCIEAGAVVGTCESDALACFPSMSCCKAVLGL